MRSRTAYRTQTGAGLPALTAIAAALLPLSGDPACGLHAAEKPGGGPPLVRSFRSGPWSAPATWERGKIPTAGDRVQIRLGPTGGPGHDPGDACPLQGGPNVEHTC
jgi:hypothetical protein